MKTSFIHTILLSLLCSWSVVGQSDSMDLVVEKFIENYLEDNELESFDYLHQIESLEEISRRPLDLNQLSLSDLDPFFFLSPIQKQSIIEHRNLHGNYLALEELQTVNQLNSETSKILKRFFTLDNGIKPLNVWNQFKTARHTIFTKYKQILQDRKGYLPDENGEKAYVGNDQHYLIRYRMDGGSKLKAGFIAEKDPGEAFFSSGNKQGFDFYSAHIYMRDAIKHVQTLALGDYSISMGQGLILHNDFGNGKSAYVMNFKREGRAIRPYNSVNESNYFRGMATTINLGKRMGLTTFFSTKKIDGTLISDTIDNEDFEGFTSIIRDGLHRTSSEISKKGSVTQTNYGGSLKYKINKLSLSINHVSYQFSKSLERVNQGYNLFAFSGQSLQNTSFDYSYIKKNINIFGEVARSSNGGLAQIHSILVSLDKKVDASLSYRKYDADYQVLEANAFSEASLPINEEAIYLALEIRPDNRWKISGYADFWKSPWLKFNIDAPSSGKEALVRLEYTQRKLFNIYIQYRYENKFQNQAGDKIDFITPIIQHRVRIHLANKVSKDLEIRNRVEWVNFSKFASDSKGYLIFNDIIYKPLGKKYSFTTRYALFDTDDFNSRIYSFENDIQYEFAVPFYYEQGKRFYFLTKYKLSRTLTLEGRYSLTSYKNIRVISDGTNDEINGNNRSEIKLQLRLSL